MTNERVWGAFLSIAALLTITSTAICAVDFKATVDDPGPTVGSRLTYTVTLSTDGSLPDIIPPDFDGFDIVSGPSSSTSIQMINMAISKSESLTYILRPNRPGSLTIGPAKAKVKGKLLTSNPVTVEVLQAGAGGNAASQPSRGRSAPNQPNAAAPPTQTGRSHPVFLTATADKPTLYKLEMATITYRLYLKVNVLNYVVVKTPQATGFWTEEFAVSNRPVLEDVSIRGENYKVAVVRKIGVFPTRAGQLKLDPLTIDVTIQTAGRRSRDPFDSFFDDPFFSRGGREVKTLTCDPITLEVRDLPVGAPPDFHGDVGNYQLRLSYDKSEVAQNDAITVKATVSGVGYLKSVDAPKLILPSGFEQFAPTVEADVNVAGDAMRGKKTFTYLVIPRRSGRFTLSPVSFSFFDPNNRGYETVTDGGLEVNVTPSAGGEESVFSGRTPSEVTLMESDIRFIKSLSGPLSPVSIPPYRTGIFFFMLALAPMLFLGGVGWEKIQEARHSDPIAVRRRKASALMKKTLEEAEAHARSGSALKAVETASKGLSELVGAVIDEPTAGLTTELIRTRLVSRGAENDLVDRTIRLLSEADRIRFGGGGSSSSVLDDLLSQFRQTTEALEKIR